MCAYTAAKHCQTQNPDTSWTLPLSAGILLFSLDFALKINEWEIIYIANDSCLIRNFWTL